MTKNRTISYEEHFVQVGFYQSILKEKESEIKKLKDQLKLSNDLLIKSKGHIELILVNLHLNILLFV